MLQKEYCSRFGMGLPLGLFQKIMKTKTFLLASLLLIAFCVQKASAQCNRHNDVEIYDTDTGDNCSSDDSFSLHYRNASSENLDIIICFKKTDGSWDKRKVSNVKSRGTGVQYTCHGTGQYKVAARLAGHYECEFSSCDE